MRKVIALNSGGFDSVVMLHELGDYFQSSEVDTLFFNYGQPNAENELKCAKAVAWKLGYSIKVIELPKIDWSQSNFFNKDFKDVGSQYLEYRNLIFMSYAMSYAQSRGATEIHMAILKSHYGYADTSPDFINAFNGLSKLSDIEVVTPFAKLDKVDLSLIAFKHGILPYEYSSCDTPINGLPCGKCPDCEALKDIGEHLKTNTPIKAWIRSFDPDDEEFQRLLVSAPITELRLLHNNACQLNCSHCFYGFNETKRPVLSKEELFDGVKQAIDLGVKNIHFSGKEPLYDEEIFWYAEQIRAYSPETTFDVVTNGINVPKFAQRLKESGFSKVFLSVDDVMGLNGYRVTKNVSAKALDSLNEVNMDLEVFIDLHENNYNKVEEIITLLNKAFGVKSFYIRTIKPLGNALNITKLLSVEQLNETFNILSALDLDISMTLSFGVEYTYDILDAEEDLEIKEAVNILFDYGSCKYTDHLDVYPEVYCGRYESQLTLTPDGYVLGCASEVGSPDYDKVSAGNIKDSPLSSIARMGKKIGICANCNQKCGEKLIFKKCTFLE